MRLCVYAFRCFSLFCNEFRGNVAFVQSRANPALVEERFPQQIAGRNAESSHESHRHIMLTHCTLTSVHDCLQSGGYVGRSSPLILACDYALKVAWYHLSIDT